jgi:hypothetical protein
MKMKIWVWAAVFAMMLGGWVMLAPVRGESSTKASTDEVLYEDDTGQSSAKITQVMPDSSKTLLTLDHIKRVRIKADILIVEWGGSLTTMLPKHFISEMTINKRNAAATAPAKKNP